MLSISCLHYPVTNAKHKLQYPATNAKHKLQYHIQFEWHQELEYFFSMSLVDALNDYCSFQPQKCHLWHWDTTFCSFPPSAVENLAGYPKRIDDFNVELRIFVGHSHCCYKMMGEWDPMVPKTALMEAFNSSKITIENSSGVHIAYLETEVEDMELILRRWSFTFGLGVVIFAVLAATMYLRLSERRRQMSQFWKKTLERTRRNAEVVDWRHRRRSYSSKQPSEWQSEWEESSDTSRTPERERLHTWDIPKPTSRWQNKEELRRRHMKKLHARMQQLKQQAEPTHRTAALMLFRPWVNRASEGNATPPVEL